ncbi:MAG: cupin domain-containing protein [Proteobacteria bacterium]|jgi:quercetin dioxygenase-like cupin family protein|nr:cupin domain-containing protein [Pseudomonadota bacterium]
MSAKAFVVGPMNRPQEWNVVGEHITVLVSGDATGGYEIFLQDGPQESGPPPHSHPWDESFYVVKGKIEFGIGEDRLVAVPGTLVHLPAGVTHWFRFGEGGGQMVTVTSRIGASRMFADIDREISPARPDLERLVAIGARHGLTVAR